MKLKDRLALCPGEMLHVCGPEAKRPAGHRPSRRLIKLVSHPDIEGAGDNGDTLDLRMPVWRNLEAVRQPKTHCEKTLLRRIAFQHGKLGSSRQRCRAILPLNLGS